MINQPTEKFEIKRTEEQDLKIFFMMGRKLSEERIIATIAYKLEDAFIKAKKDYPGFSLIYNGQNVTVRELLEKLQLEESISPPVDNRVEEEPLPPEKIKFEQFRQGLMLVVDEYTKGKDKEELKKIIGRLKASKKNDKS
jgi:hypothetical protein